MKDGFACLDLGVAGFRPLFQAEWVVRRPAKGRRMAPRGWSAVTTEAQLRGWRGWLVELPGGSGFFRPALLKDETIAVLAGYDGDRIVAGTVANRSATVIGLNSVFDIRRRPRLRLGGRRRSRRDALGRPADRRLRLGRHAARRA